jgi:hypothetical protein
MSSPEQEQQIGAALTDAALGWMRDPDGFAYSTIEELVVCSTDEAKQVLTDLCDRRLIECVSESGGRPAADRYMESYGCKWVKLR